ncbi:Exosome RNA helicase MTR4 [Cichlidogyrus casuarinus]|uniref:Exosome RNA helicase MTR4 n=1 Tax=Cichlidogyrus casuarinus TaxID=1844966 RepID=A0ABD2Q1A8_9PLAT
MYRLQSTLVRQSKDTEKVELCEEDMDVVVVEEEEPVAGTSAEEQPAKRTAEILPSKCNCIKAISAVRVLVPKDLRSSEARENCIKTIDRVKEKMGGSLPDLDPIKDMKITEPKFVEIYEKLEAFKQRLEKHPLSQEANVKEICDRFESRDHLQNEMDTLQASCRFASHKEEMRSKVSLIQLNELSSRKRVLRRLGYCSELDLIALKGRVACEITSADEILLTELLFDGTFNKLSPENCAALLSCFVCEERGQSKLNSELDKDLVSALRVLQETARRIARISNECRLSVDVEDYVNSFKPAMMGTVADWAKGKSFASLCEGTAIFEGTIVRTLRRLEELLRQMANAAHTIDNSTLEEKFTRSIELIKRDIVFAASLYL